MRNKVIRPFDVDSLLVSRCKCLSFFFLDKLKASDLVKQKPTASLKSFLINCPNKQIIIVFILLMTPQGRAGPSHVLGSWLSSIDAPRI